MWSVTKWTHLLLHTHCMQGGLVLADMKTSLCFLFLGFAQFTCLEACCCWVCFFLFLFFFLFFYFGWSKVFRLLVDGLFLEGYSKKYIWLYTVFCPVVKVSSMWIFKHALFCWTFSLFVAPIALFILMNEWLWIYQQKVFNNMWCA